MKFWLSICIAAILIVAMLRFHYGQTDIAKTAPQSLARLGLQEMNNITGDAAALDRAIANFAEALKSDPNDAVALFGLGWAQQTKGDTVNAERNYSQAIIQNNDICKYSHFNLSFIKEKNGDIPAALQEIEMAKVCDPSFPQLKLRELQLRLLIANKVESNVPGNK